jgi:hypothetical protein
MSDLQRLLNVFDHIGIPSSTDKEPHDFAMNRIDEHGKSIEIVTLVEQTLTIESGDGIEGSYTEFYFDKDGKFITWVVLNG